MTTEKTKQTLADAMTAQDVAGRMGYSIDYFYVLCREGKIPHHQPNGPKGRYHFSRQRLRERLPDYKWD